MKIFNATTSFMHLTIHIATGSKLNLLTSDALPMNELSSELSATLSLPQDIVSNIQKGRDVRMAFTVYNSSTLFPVRNSSLNMSISDTVVGSQVVSVQVNGVADGTRLAGPVTFSLRLTKSPTLEPDQLVTDRRCVFWDFESEGELHEIIIMCIVIICSVLSAGSGDWNSTGCILTAFNESTNMVSCECDHLTNFACLVVSSQ